MGLDIVTNVMAQDASNSLAISETNMQNSLQKLSSGYQINKAADDASGLVISQHLQAQIGGFQQAQADTQSAINVVQTADGALNEVGTILQRINTLAVESANTSATDTTAQQAAQSEVAQSLSSLTDIAQTTVYGNNTLLVNGTNTMVNYTFQVGEDNSSASQVAFQVTALNLANLGLVTDSLHLGSAAAADGVGGISAQGLAVNSTYTVTTSAMSFANVAGTGGGGTLISKGSFVVAATTNVTFAISVNGGTAALVTFAGITGGQTFSAASFAWNITSQLAAQGYGTAAVNVDTTGFANTTAGDGTFTITDALGGATYNLMVTAVAATVTALGLAASTNAVGVNEGISINGGATVALAGTYATAATTLNIPVAGTTFAVNLTGALGATSFLATADYSGGLGGTYAGANLDLVNFSVTSSNAISTINNAITAVSAVRGQLGAYQNELQHTSDNEGVMIQNLQASNAQIQDTNMASTMVNFTQNQVLVQAGVSMLAQANQIPQMVLKLLG
jgi:flagellin